MLLIIKKGKSIPGNCYHCGDPCNGDISADDHYFCCNGCRQVYLLLNENGLCTYYDLDDNPGIKAKGKFVSERYAYLDDPATMQKLVQFSSETQTNVTFSLPQMHCSSCVFLLESLHRIDPGIIKSSTNFQRKEVFIIFNPEKISLRKVVELLAFIGYEPDISLQDDSKIKPASFNRNRIYRIGVAGFCFANIMMLSFPEYFSSGNIGTPGLRETFSWLIMALSLPVLLYSASGFFVSAWKGLRQRFLNIDAPIVLAIIVAFARSYYEIISGTGPGFLDSGTGIVFFMLVGRWFQDKTYDSLSFERNYRSYFPLGVTVIKDGIEENIPVTRLKKGDEVIIRNEEMVPADSILLHGEASVDYSFVSGENAPVTRKEGALIYAGGKQLGGAIRLLVVHDASQSYITQLWNNDVFRDKKRTERSFIHPWSRYFTLVLFSIALGAVIFWWINDPSRILTVLTAVLLVACPCSLLLSATFTFGNMMRIFGKNRLYLKNAGVIEVLAKVDAVVFDKTGTLTQGHQSEVTYRGTPLTEKEKLIVKNIARHSSHPLSKLVASYLNIADDQMLDISQFREHTGSGVEAVVNGRPVKLGSAAFMNAGYPDPATYDTGTQVHLQINKVHMGRFTVSNHYREGLKPMLRGLKKMGYELHLLSGDNDSEIHNLRQLFGQETTMRFVQSPQQKLDYVQELQAANKRVLMLGDGLNDAGALVQSDVGIAVSDNTARFTPACDAILDGAFISRMDRLLRFAGSGKKIVTASFVLSILYNIVGISFAVSGNLSPLVAAVLMPASSISIVLFVTLLSNFSAAGKGLSGTVGLA